VQSDPLRELLERAFWSARTTGKRDWNRMLVSVLKNRLLQLTNRNFKEADFGASSLLELMSRYRDLVAVDSTTRPVVIEWLAARGTTAISNGRIRADLWRATLDFSSGTPYEWDTVAQLARPASNPDPAHRIPTIDTATLAGWRDAFVRAHEAALSDPLDRDRLHSWAAHSLGSQGLPRALRALWNDHLKREVVERLTGWFTASGHLVPELILK
jgi:hypothetical protein